MAFYSNNFTSRKKGNDRSVKVGTEVSGITSHIASNEIEGWLYITSTFMGDIFKIRKFEACDAILLLVAQRKAAAALLVVVVVLR